MESPRNSRYVWIRTQDGSPTLWNNDIGEPYRSVKGAFHESLIVFVKPALEFAQKLYTETHREIIVGEFGLGAGTNWIFFSALAKHFGIPFKYFAIEKDPEAFEMALLKWEEEKDLLRSKIQMHLGVDVSLLPQELEKPIIYRSLEEFTLAMKDTHLKCDVWFHDPFGSGVNPEGYSEESLNICAQSWNSPFRGFSYACNGAFQKTLKSLGLGTSVVELKSPPLKKEALCFYSLS